MGLLDGNLPRTFARAMRSVFLPGTLHRVATSEDADGRMTSAFVSVAVRYVRETMSEAARATAGIPSTDVRILVLADGIGPAPALEDEITIDTGRYRIAFVERDPATVHFILRGSPI